MRKGTGSGGGKSGGTCASGDGESTVVRAAAGGESADSLMKVACCDCIVCAPKPNGSGWSRGGANASGSGDGGAGQRMPEFAAAVFTRLTARWWFAARFASSDDCAFVPCAMNASGVSSESAENSGGAGTCGCLAGGRGGEGVRSVGASWGDACMKSSKSSKRPVGTDAEDVDEKSARSDEIDDEKLAS